MDNIEENWMEGSESLFQLLEAEAQSSTFQMVEGVRAKLSYFVYLARFGLFEETLDWFKKHLEQNISMFPVLEEYLDFLLQQRAYREVIQLLKNLSYFGPITLREADVTLLNLMETLAKVCLRGMTTEDLEVAFRFWDYMKTLVTEEGWNFNITQIHAVEIFLHIVTVALEPESPDIEKLTNPPWAPVGSPRWSGFRTWYTFLKSSGLHWEAQKIQQILLPNLDLEDAKDTFIKRDQFRDVANSIRAGEFDESLVLTKLIICNNIVEYLVELQPEWISLAEAYLGISRYFQIILSENNTIENIDRGRPLLRVRQLQDVVSRVKSSPTFNATERGYEGVFASIPSIDPFSQTDERNKRRTLLSYAAEYGRWDIVEILAEQGSYVNLRDSQGRTPLLYAAMNNRLEAARILLDNKAYINAKDVLGRSPLWHAARECCPGMVDLLLRRGADINCKDKEGKTILSSAMDVGSQSAVRLLIERGAREA